MKKIKLIRYCMIAAGIVISAAFYIISGAQQEDNALYIDVGDGGAGDSSGISVRQGTQTDGQSTGSTGGENAASANAVSGDAAGEVMTGMSDELKDELELLIRSAVREELVSISDDGYLEAAMAEAAEYSAAEAERRKGLVNINTADADELMTLDGIGRKRADDIIAYRQQHGAFAEISDIMKVSGIKASSFEKIRDKICI